MLLDGGEAPFHKCSEWFRDIKVIAATERVLVRLVRTVGDKATRTRGSHRIADVTVDKTDTQDN